MNWFKKKLYTSGPGSPGVTAKIFAQSYLEYVLSGLNSCEAINAVLQSYFTTYETMGIEVSDNVKNIAWEIEGDLALATFVLIVIGNSNNLSTIEQLQQDRSMILEIIIDEQNKILSENRTMSDIEARMVRLNF